MKPSGGGQSLVGWLVSWLSSSVHRVAPITYHVSRSLFYAMLFRKVKRRVARAANLCYTIYRCKIADRNCKCDFRIALDALSIILQAELHGQTLSSPVMSYLYNPIVIVPLVLGNEERQGELHRLNGLKG